MQLVSHVRYSTSRALLKIVGLCVMCHSNVFILFLFFVLFFLKRRADLVRLDQVYPEVTYLRPSSYHVAKLRAEISNFGPKCHLLFLAFIISPMTHITTLRNTNSISTFDLKKGVKGVTLLCINNLFVEYPPDEDVCFSHRNIEVNISLSHCVERLFKPYLLQPICYYSVG